MTTKISAIIAQHIATEARLIIPEVGTLIRRKESGEIVFMEMLRKSDGVLTGLIVNALDVSPSKASEIVANYIATIKQQLTTNKKFIIDGVGVLLARTDGGIVFSFNPRTRSIPEPECGVDILEDDEPIATTKPITPIAPVAPTSPATPAKPISPAMATPSGSVEHTVKPQSTTPSPQPKRVIYKTEEEEEPAERKSKIKPHHTRKKMDGITIVALVALAMALLALVWGMIPSGDNIELDIEQRVEVNE